MPWAVKGMTLSKVIPREQAGQVQPWQIPELTNTQAGFVTPFPLDSNLPVQASKAEELHQAGFQQGYEEGLALAKKELANQQVQLEETLQALAQPLKRLNQAVEQELVELSLAVALQILRREITQDPKHVIGLIREAVNQLPAASRQIRIYLNPDDAQVVRETLNQQDDQHWQIKDDPTLPHGSCQVRSETSFLDAGIDALVNRLAVDMLGGHRTTDKNEIDDESDQPR